MNKYLTPSSYIDYQEPDVQAKASLLANGLASKLEIASACFEFVRDETRHSWDHQSNPVTCKASDVLKHGTGYCYAKSHLLAALLRANEIPAGLCYQRLTIENDRPSFSLDGLNAVWLEEYGWYRIDARGNNEEVDAQFMPPTEKLAFPIVTEGEGDLAEIWAEPIACVVDTLERDTSFPEVAAN